VKPANRTTFRELVAGEQIFSPCIWDVFSARAAEATGYKATLLSGGALGYSMVGVPDIGLLNAEELIFATERIADATPLPMVVDADDGYSETAIGVYRTCRRLAKAGAMGITLDDTTGVRGYERWGEDFRAGVAAGKVDGNIPHPMVPREVWLSKIKAALDATADTDCVVIARTESKLGMGFDEAIERTVLARELGAEMTLIIGLKSLDECQRVAKADEGWKMYPDVASVNGVPDVELADIEPLGFNFVTMHYLEKASMHGMLEYGRRVIADRNTVYADGHGLDGFTVGDLRAAEHGDQPWLDREREWKKV
jgi:methylisocitrate lyase